MDYHGGEEATDPVVLSVVGFSGHGKTVFLCALFEYLDHHLTYIWPDFFNLVLDQDSLSTLNANREKLDDTKLPDRTSQSFPRPGIFRLTNMPYRAGNKMPPLADTTILIYDPPGEAFVTEDKIVEFASFVKRSDCVLFLVDVTALGDSIASKMAKLLDTYVLGMRRMGIEKKSQHMIVVYTKSDDMKVSVPEFVSYLEKEPKLKDYINEQRPETLADPHVHLGRLEYISHLLETFTWSELNAGKFMHVAKDWFASVSYTVVSSLGAAPEQGQDEKGDVAEMKLTVRMSPRCVADPLLYVLAKSIKIKEEPIIREPELTPQPTIQPWMTIAIISGIVALIIILLSLWFGGSADKSQSNLNSTPRTSASPQRAASPSKPPTPPLGMAYVPGGEFTMGSAGGDIYEQPPHKVTVKPFFIDLYEVTREEYARFVKEKGRAPPPNWQGGQYPQGTARQPVTGVTWDDAVAYATWAGKRLPTEEEWEFAARGSDSRLYPWGKEWQAGIANAGGSSSSGLVNVGTFKGMPPFGIHDMIGNAWEWTASDLKAYPGGHLPFVPKGDLKVVRGGSWKEGPKEATATYRGHLPARNSKDYSATGFRCAQDVTALPASPGKQF
jgi:formylglycine-generating enzyme required for sulfatase activity